MIAIAISGILNTWTMVFLKAVTTKTIGEGVVHVAKPQKQTLHLRLLFWVPASKEVAMKIDKDKLTSAAYSYAEKNKAVSKKVIDAYLAGFDKAFNLCHKADDDYWLEVIGNRYRSTDQLESLLAHSDARRGLNKEEQSEAKIKTFIANFRSELSRLKEKQEEYEYIFAYERGDV